MPVGAEQLTPERALRDTVPVSSDVGEYFRKGRRIDGRYALLRPLGMRGNVWLARDASGRELALKTGPSAVVEHERRILAATSHPNIVQLVDCVAVGPAPVLVLEHLPGGDLVSLAGFDAAHWLDPIADVVAALAWLHAAGFAHRDLKARNVMLDTSGRARLIDFGSAARLGSAWTAGGTTVEAVDPGRGTAAVAADDDVYALAALAFELLHGVPPGRGAERPGAPPALAALVAAVLAPREASPRPGLNRFAAVIESLLVP